MSGRSPLQPGHRPTGAPCCYPPSVSPAHSSVLALGHIVQGCSSELLPTAQVDICLQGSGAGGGKGSSFALGGPALPGPGVALWLSQWAARWTAAAPPAGAEPTCRHQRSLAAARCCQSWPCTLCRSMPSPALSWVALKGWWKGRQNHLSCSDSFSAAALPGCLRSHCLLTPLRPLSWLGLLRLHCGQHCFSISFLTLTLHAATQGSSQLLEGLSGGPLASLPPPQAEAIASPLMSSHRCQSTPSCSHPHPPSARACQPPQLLTQPPVHPPLLLLRTTLNARPLRLSLNGLQLTWKR